MCGVDCDAVDVRVFSKLIIVKNDTFRTLATDKEFKGKVDEDMLIRLLEAFIWKSKSRTLSDTSRIN
jgi:hypothetical protein